MTIKRKHLLYKVATILVVVATLVIAIYIMAHRLGLSDNLDFGAGAYYYADIPDYQKVINDDIYQAKLPYIIYVVLFLAWGALMWKLWKWIDKRK